MRGYLIPAISAQMKFLAFFLLSQIVVSADSKTTAQALEKLREQRTKALESKLEELKKAHLQALSELRRKNQTDAEALAFIDTEIKIVNASTTEMPDGLKFTLDFKEKIEDNEFHKPKIRKTEDLVEFLVGTKWEFWTNGEFLGAHQELEFIDETKCILDGNEILWKATDTEVIWLDNTAQWGGTYLKFIDKSFQKLAGGFASNWNHKRSAEWVSTSK